METLFNESVSNRFLRLVLKLLFLIITIVVVAKGVQQGIEKASKLMMPALFVIFIILIVRSLTLESAMEGVTFFLNPDFSSLTSQGILYALRSIVFSLSVGVSVMVTYSSYLSKSESLVQPAFSVVMMNLFISIFAGLSDFSSCLFIRVSTNRRTGIALYCLAVRV